jgi:hypothetical protein
MWPMAKPRPSHFSQASGRLWRGHSCLPRRDSSRRVLFAGTTCWNECQHGTHECVRHGCIRSTHPDRRCEKCGLVSVKGASVSWPGTGPPAGRWSARTRANRALRPTARLRERFAVPSGWPMISDVPHSSPQPPVVPTAEPRRSHPGSTVTSIFTFRKTMQVYYS